MPGLFVGPTLPPNPAHQTGTCPGPLGWKSGLSAFEPTSPASGAELRALGPASSSRTVRGILTLGVAGKLLLILQNPSSQASPLPANPSWPGLHDVVDNEASVVSCPTEAWELTSEKGGKRCRRTWACGSRPYCGAHHLHPQPLTSFPGGLGDLAKAGEAGSQFLRPWKRNRREGLVPSLRPRSLPAWAPSSPLWPSHQSPRHFRARPSPKVFVTVFSGPAQGQMFQLSFPLYSRGTLNPQ